MQTFKTDDAEKRKFLDLLLRNGYHNLPSKADYWSTAEDLEVPIFPKIMLRDCFRVLKLCLYVADSKTLHNLK